MLAPVNNDVQAPQIATAYIADTEDVAAAKEAFHLEFQNVEAGGLADKQAAGPVAPAVMKAADPVVYSHLPYLVHPATHLTYTGLHPVTYTYPLQYITPVKAEPVAEE